MTEPNRHLRWRLELIVLIAIGGFAGANLRYLLDVVVTGLPATLVANTLGSFALGVVLYRAIRSDALAQETRAVVATGVLSSFTTYSTFALQSVQATPVWMGLNVVATYALGLGGVLVARRSVRFIEWRWG